MTIALIDADVVAYRVAYACKEEPQEKAASTLSSLLANKSFLNSFSKLEFCEFNKTGIGFPLGNRARNSDSFSFSQVFIQKQDLINQCHDLAKVLTVLCKA